jgi:hypothetical protein
MITDAPARKMEKRISPHSESVGIPDEICVKFPPLVAVPYLVVTVTGPEEPPPTTAVMDITELMTVLDADVPPNFATAPAMKFVPSIETFVPSPPEPGLKFEIVGFIEEDWSLATAMSLL